MNALMTKHDELFKELFSNSIGMNRLFNRLANAEQSNFPPYNIVHENGNIFVELALAGYSKDDIEVVVEDGVLSIEGLAASSRDGDFHHKGIASRRFKRSFSLGEHIEVKSAELKDGLLTVALQEVLPPEKQPKVIEVK
jgi:molecular chaperone IbpA|tara:strand:+ start:1361 stop:1777 length:417 start_codon:yes stop_codon:yes gene_type:complete